MTASGTRRVAPWILIALGGFALAKGHPVVGLTVFGWIALVSILRLTRGRSPFKTAGWRAAWTGLVVGGSGLLGGVLAIWYALDKQVPLVVALGVLIIMLALVGVLLWVRSARRINREERVDPHEQGIV